MPYAACWHVTGQPIPQAVLPTKQLLALLLLLQAGGCYVPLDPGFPSLLTTCPCG
jgi:hypothetical protein